MVSASLDDLPSFIAVAVLCISLAAGLAAFLGIRARLVVAATSLVVLVLGPTIFGLGPNALRTSVAYFLHFCKRSNVFTPEASRQFDFDEIRPGLLLGRQPRHMQDLKRIQQEGVTAVVSLNQPWELFVPDLGSALSGLGMKHLHIHAPDFQGPELSDTVAAVDFIRQQLLSNKSGKVYIHCNAGRGRSATVLAAFLLASDNAERDRRESWDAAAEAARVVQEMRAVRPKVTPNLARYPITGQSRALRLFASKEAPRIGASWKKAR